MLLSRHLRRIGDLVGGTVVIQERRVVLPREPLILERIQPLDHEEFNRFVPSAHVLVLIDQFLGRRFVLTHRRGHEIARPLAVALARRLEYRGDPKLVTRYPMAFLARVYVTFLRRDDDESNERGRQPERAARTGRFQAAVNSDSAPAATRILPATEQATGGSGWELIGDDEIHE